MRFLSLLPFFDAISDARNKESMKGEWEKEMKGQESPSEGPGTNEPVPRPNRPVINANCAALGKLLY